MIDATSIPADRCIADWRSVDRVRLQQCAELVRRAVVLDDADMAATVFGLLARAAPWRVLVAKEAGPTPHQRRDHAR